LLIDPGAKTEAGGTGVARKKKSVSSVRSARASQPWSSPAFRIALVGLLFLWGGAEQIRFALATNEGNLSALRSASRLNPYDSMVEARIASAEGKAGQRDQAIAELTRAVAINPYNAGLQHACARAMIEDGRYEDAYKHYAKMLALFPRDADALVNYGLLAARLGRPEEAMDSWQKAVEVDPDQPNPHLYLANAFDQKGEPAGAARHWETYLGFTAAHPDDPAVGARQETSATIQLADDESRINRADLALPKYLTAIDLAQRAGDAKLGSLAFAHLGDLQDKAGDAKSAVQSYQRGLALDAKAGDSSGEAVDWFNYGQFLRRNGLPDDLSYACFVRAESESLLAKTPGPELAAVQTARGQVEKRLGKKVTDTRKNLPDLLASAISLPATSFGMH
jgi:tetratricopeptide (TPR) repeat protein